MTRAEWIIAILTVAWLVVDLYYILAQKPRGILRRIVLWMSKKARMMVGKGPALDSVLFGLAATYGSIELYGFFRGVGLIWRFKRNFSVNYKKRRR